MGQGTVSNKINHFSERHSRKQMTGLKKIASEKKVYKTIDYKNQKNQTNVNCSEFETIKGWGGGGIHIICTNIKTGFHVNISKS